MPKNNNIEKKNQKNLKKYQDNNILMDSLAIEGHALLKESSSFTPQKLEDKLSDMSSNPYVKARIQVLKQLPLWRQKEIKTMEKTNDINNRHYSSFVDMIIELGDSFSA